MWTLPVAHHLRTVQEEPPPSVENEGDVQRSTLRGRRQGGRDEAGAAHVVPVAATNTVGAFPLDQLEKDLAVGAAVAVLVERRGILLVQELHPELHGDVAAGDGQGRLWAAQIYETRFAQQQAVVEADVRRTRRRRRLQRPRKQRRLRERGCRGGVVAVHDDLRPLDGRLRVSATGAGRCRCGYRLSTTLVQQQHAVLRHGRQLRVRPRRPRPAAVHIGPPTHLRLLQGEPVLHQCDLLACHAVRQQQHVCAGHRHAGPRCANAVRRWLLCFGQLHVGACGGGPPLAEAVRRVQVECRADAVGHRQYHRRRVDLRWREAGWVLAGALQCATDVWQQRVGRQPRAVPSQPLNQHMRQRPSRHA
ncbi:hypothetical protein NQL31_002522 [Lotmaria passim]